ncbi:MAG: hypothetical protein JWM11_7048 [Planctomycetaceae bacterium]|nr:hypothetical protein [Planctomycetaceae bacterium]
MADTDSNENAGPRKGLWALMGQKPDEGVTPSKPQTEETPLEKTPAKTPESSASPPTSKPTARPKGLWSLMHHADQVTETAAEFEQHGATDVSQSNMQSAFEAPIAPIKGADKRLRQLQRIEDPLNADDQVSEDFETQTVAERTGERQAATSVKESRSPAELPESRPPSLRVAAAVEPKLQILGMPAAAPPVIGGLSQSARWSLILGGLSVQISCISIVPAIWARIPPSVCGFIALLFGFLALSEIQKSRNRVRGQSIAYAGMALGLLGMFAGPMIYTPLDVYGKLCDWHTGGHLKQVGMATEAYYQQEHAFPAGGIFHIPKPGISEPMHGWMTQVLPHLPEGAALYQHIDLQKPYFDAANLPVMQQLVPSFLASGGSHSLIHDKFGPAHFAGLGGVVTQSDGSIAHAGVFDINSETTRDDIADGLSNTMLIGEIGHDYPAWGEPRNWRQIGKGLNRDPNGFGNARHSGAMFLMADGSVKFFPNQTDPKILQALSTRDGDEGF